MAWNLNSVHGCPVTTHIQVCHFALLLWTYSPSFLTAWPVLPLGYRAVSCPASLLSLRETCSLQGFGLGAEFLDKVKVPALPFRYCCVFLTPDSRALQGVPSAVAAATRGFLPFRAIEPPFLFYSSSLVFCLQQQKTKQGNSICAGYGPEC